MDLDEAPVLALPVAVLGLGGLGGHSLGGGGRDGLNGLPVGLVNHLQRCGCGRRPGKEIFFPCDKLFQV